MKLYHRCRADESAVPSCIEGGAVVVGFLVEVENVSC